MLNTTIKIKIKTYSNKNRKKGKKGGGIKGVMIRKETEVKEKRRKK